ncbi:MAG: hypothetical protein AAGC85_05855 [Bacteroidota bacterium]
MKHWMRMSLWYPAAVLSFAGLGLLLLPNLMTGMLFSSKVYPQEIVQFAGMFMMVLSVFVYMTIRLEVTVIYPITIYLRLFMTACLFYLYLSSQNPLFLIIIIILIVGLGLSFLGILMDKRANSPT